MEENGLNFFTYEELRELEKEADIELGFDMSTDSQEEQEQPTELSEAAKEIMKIVDSTLINQQQGKIKNMKNSVPFLDKSEELKQLEDIFTRVRVFREKEETITLINKDGEKMLIKIPPPLFERTKPKCPLPHERKSPRGER